MTYTADMNYTLTLESGNWMTGFIANIEKREVTFTYHDRRRAGQIARTYTVKFAEDLSTVEDIVAVSAKAGRIEHFKNTVARDVCANIIRRAKMVKFEEDLAKEVEQVEPAKEEQTVTTIIVETLVNKMGVVVSAFALIAFIMTLIYFLFGGVSTADAVMSALIGAEMGALVALFAGNVAMDVKYRK